MPLTKPKNRSKSRSPAVSSAPFVQSPTTPRSFLPPAHYAAAAGLAFPPSHDNRPPNISQNQGPRHLFSEPGLPQGRYAAGGYQPNALYMPESSSASMEEHTGSRMSFLTRKLSRSSSGSSGKNVADQRQDQLSNLPLVEAQLLPSLRDTIDRMTSPQSTSKFPNLPSGDYQYERTYREEERDGTSKNFSLTSPMAPEDPAPPSSRLRRPMASAKASTSMAPQESHRGAGPKASESSRTPTIPKAKPKPILKSVLKGSSTNHAPSYNQHEPESPSKNSPSRSLRSVRSMFGKKTPQPSAPIAGPSSIGGENASQRAGYGLHERSRTDPGRVSKIPSRSAYQTRTSQPDSFNVPPTSRAHTNDSGSELELQSERGRALFVTNAEIVPSSSSSESNFDGATRSAPAPSLKSPGVRSRVSTAKYGHAAPDHKDQSSGLPRHVGLGLDMPREGGSAGYDEFGMRSSRRPEQSAESQARRDERPILHRTSSEASGEHRAGGRSPGVLPSPWEQDTLDHSARHRRAALMGIVNELESGFAGLQGEYPDDQSESEYNGQHGLAVSGSADFSAQDLARMDHEADVRKRSVRFSGFHTRDFVPEYSPKAAARPSRSADPSQDRQSWQMSRPSDDVGRSRRTSFEQQQQQTYEEQSDDASLSEYPSDADENREDGFAEDLTPKVQASQRQSPYLNMPSRSHPPPEPRAPLRHAEQPPPSRAPSHLPVPQTQRKTSDHTTRPRHPGTSSANPDGGHPNRTPKVTFARPPPTQHNPAKPSAPPSRRRSGHAADGAFPGPERHRDSYAGPDRLSKDLLVSDAYRLRKSSGIAEAREREAFGLPPLSPPKAVSPLTHANSVSSLGSDRWQDDGDDLTQSAEAIFERLGHDIDGAPRRSSAVYRAQTAPPPPHAHAQDVNRSNRDQGPPTSQSAATLSESSSVRSIYEDEVPPRPWQQRERDLPALHPDPDGRTWRSTLPPSAYQSLLERYGETEMQRQQAIWELYESERTFVRRLRTIIHLFIRPLRVQGTKAWISGVPGEVSRLFDWLEDIINLHAQISTSLHSALTEQYPVVIRVAEVIRRFVPRLEVHQPYIVRVEEVVLMIKKAVGEGRSDFGEFVRLQEEQEECQGWSLEAFMAEPVNRLVDYPASFRRLWEFTPRNHVDHLATFSLLHSTETMIRVMREVKSREDEYDLIKDILDKVEGLPQAVQLARRERRLLARGRLLREFASDRPRSGAGGRDRSVPPLGQGSDKFLQLPGASARSNGKPAARHSKLLDPRAGSTRSTTSASSAFSTASSSTPPTTPAEFDPIDFDPHVWERRTSRERSSSTLHVRLSDTAKQTPIHAFVFSDLIILASPVAARHAAKGAPDTWRLLEGVGISRILGVSEDGNRIVLDLLPMDTDDLETGIIPDSAPVTVLAVSVPDIASSGAALDAPTLRDIRGKWVSALAQCSQHTLRALSFPSESGKYLAQGPTVDLGRDAARHSVMALLASGLPLPKSPSLQVEDFSRGRGGDAMQQEREERGWWGLRFQHVLREMQRSDFSTEGPRSLAPGEGVQAPRKRVGVSRPRQLKLSTLSSSESVHDARQERR